MNHISAVAVRPSIQSGGAQGRILARSSNDAGDATNKQSTAALSRRKRSGNQNQRRGVSHVRPSNEGLQAFRYFHTDGASRMGGSFDYDLWTVNLLQSAKTYPAVWHACTALSALHQKSTICSPNTDIVSMRVFGKRLDDFALEQYNVSLRYLIHMACQTHLSSVDKEIFLTVNVLLAFMCGARNSHVEAWTHVDNGLRLFFQWRIWDRKGPYGSHQPAALMPVDSMIAMLCRLDSQTMNMRSTPWPGESWMGVLQTQALSSRPFESLAEAYYAFEIIWNGFFGLNAVETFNTYRTPTLHVQHPTPDAWHIYRRAFDNWKLRFEALETQIQASFCDGGEHVRAVRILKARKLLVDVVLGINFTDRELRWDTFQKECKIIVEISAGLLEPTVRSKRLGTWQGPETHTFSFGPSLCEPLFAVARGCRVPGIRQKAIELLKQCPMVEGVAHVHFMAMLAEAIMHFEHGVAWGETKRGDRQRDCECVRDEYICGNHRVCEERIVPPEREGELPTVYVLTEWDKRYSEDWQKLPMDF
ncbi:hypothetical protein QQS21_003939 [Conoideocrella luteorostrata]|uniref:Uncharacterized protein n=1 Tax=Conoideocrella luteorostrata TaxID=1105319 RepID=A0AAJ0CWK2_9HYPO|nr:hypothetical protein QQS21_003939 [Conoideocrella luteorostrata]